jgi:hypothetical protein
MHSADFEMKSSFPCIREIPLSMLGSEIGCRGNIFVFFIIPGKCLDSILKSVQV